MNIQELRKIFNNAVYEVFEKMYYVFLEGRERHLPERRERVLNISFSGPATGNIVVFFSEDLAQQMIANSLNLDREEVTEPIRQDCLKECLNMICGDFLQKYNHDRLFKMGLPIYGEPAAGTAAGGTGEGVVYVAFDGDGGGYFEAVLMMNDEQFTRED